MDKIKDVSIEMHEFVLAHDYTNLSKQLAFHYIVDLYIRDSHDLRSINVLSYIVSQTEQRMTYLDRQKLLRI